MNVLTHISLNFQQPNYLTVYAAQNDRLSRYINAQLLDGSAPWTLPTGGLMTIRFRKPDGTSGFYDTLEDGSPAYNVETDGSITFGLAEQALTVPGAVPVELNFYNAAGSKLSTLTFIVAVKPSAYSDEDIASSDYYNILTAKMQQLAELSDQAEGDYQDYLSALSAFVGAPRTAPTAADMLDTNLVYVYTGSETGWTYGDWYYYNGREWVSGGVYNSAAISLDATLTNADKPAQAKAAGDLVLVQDTQPSAPVNKLWFPLTNPEEVQVPTYDEYLDLKSATTLLDDAVYGQIDATFPLEFEGGTYYSTAVGQTLQKYYSGGYDKTRKVVESTVFNAPCDVHITAKTSYAFTVFTSVNGVISGSSGLVTEYTMVAGQQYGLILRATDGTTDISAVAVSSIVDIEYTSRVDEALSVIADSGLIKLSSINILKYGVVNIAISASNGWSTRGSSVFIPTSEFLSGYKTISITANDEQSAIVCFLKTNDTTVNPSYATGTSRTVIQPGVTQEFSIPGDCNYINILYIWTNNFLPKDVKWYTGAIPEISVALMDRDKIGLIIDNWSDHTSILSTIYTNAGNIQGTTSYSATSVLKASWFVPLYGKMLELPLPWTIDTTFPNYGMSLYDKDFQPIMGRAISAFPLRGENDPHIVWVHVYIPENAKYFRTTYWMELSEDKPEFTYNLLKEIPDEYKPITHELPVDTYMQNAIRRARQLTDIKWTPRVNIPRYSMMRGGNKHFLDWFYADHEYIGIPYSGAGDDETHWSTIKDWGYTHNWVGQHIPIEAFVTAARYPNSIMGEKASQSVVSYDSSPYGDVCTALVNYVVDGPTPLRGINNFFVTSDQIFRTDNIAIANLDMNTLSIGDFLYTRAHVIFISDLMRDANGNVTHIEMSEETTVGNNNNAVLGTKFGGVARRKMWDINEFKSVYGAYIRFRRTTFYGIPYVKSKFVNTGNEGDMETMVDMACIPYLGEGAIYKVGYVHNSKICIGATGFTSLVVTKDGEAFGTFDVTGLTEVVVGFSDAGSYEAYLTDGTTQTSPCHWTVVE